MEDQKRHKIAEGNTAEIFEIGDERVLKLFKTGYSKNSVKQEYDNHCMVSRVIKNVPELFEYAEENQRYGFVMENVQGTSLASMMLNEDTFQAAMETFTTLHKEWLKNTTDSAISYTEWMIRVMHGKTDDGLLADEIKHLPEGNTLCHGDFHPYNIIVTPEKESVIIDFANVCKAPKEYDVARTYFLLREAVKENSVAEIYLQGMDMNYSDIQIYVSVLEELHQYER